MLVSLAKGDMQMDDTSKNEGTESSASDATADGQKVGSDEKATAKDADKTVAKAGGKAAKKKSGKKGKVALATPVFVVVLVAVLVVGLVCGGFAYSMLPLPGSSNELSGKTTVDEGQLDAVMGSYEYGGTTYNITVRDAIEESSTLDSAKNDDGTYNVPSSDTVLSLARNQIMLKEADNQGISVSDDDVSSYAESTVGSSDYATIASSYGMDEDTVKQLLTDSCKIKALHDQVVTDSVPDRPTAPAAPDSGQEDTPTADYAQYIINLAGDEWDSTNNTWARTDGPYYSALNSYTISNDSATYDAAQAAYYVAYSQYSSAAQQVQQEWTDYANGLLANCHLVLNTLVA